MTKNVIHQEVNPDQAKTRLDVWLVGVLGPDFSRARIQTLVKEGFVCRLEGAERILEANPARKVRAGEIYVVDVPSAVASELVAEDIPLDVLYEDEWLLVLNKPAGLTVHPSPGHDTGTLVHALLHHCRGTLSGINGEARPGIVHRIDKDTSGVMVVAKDDVTHRKLSVLFGRHDIHRVYMAICRGVPVPTVGKIEGAIGRHPVHRLKRAVVRSGGKPATTHYRVREVFGNSASLVELQLETGRTHQIRVHMSHLNHPLLGDPMYGTKNLIAGLSSAAQAAVKAFDRQALHAAELGFVHPRTGEELMFKAELPADMAGLLTMLRSI